MKVKKVISSLIAISILNFSAVLDSFASSKYQINDFVNTIGDNKHLDLSKCYKSTPPSTIGVLYSDPEHSVFYSDKGTLKLIINDDNRSFFENGGHVKVSVHKPSKVLHLNPFHWKDFFKYDYRNSFNKFNITVVKEGYLPHLIKTLINKINSIPDSIKIIGPPAVYIYSALFKGFEPASHSPAFNLLSFFPFVAFELFLSLANAPFAPLLNLINNLNPSNDITIDYGIVTTTKEDELGLESKHFPKEGEINDKLATEKQKHKQTLDTLKTKYGVAPPSSGQYRCNDLKDKDLEGLIYSKENIEQLKKLKMQNMDSAYSKLRNSVPITDGLVCILDKDNPECTYRFVFNNSKRYDNTACVEKFLENNNAQANSAQSPVCFSIQYCYGNGKTNKTVSDPFLLKKLNKIGDIGSNKSWWDSVKQYLPEVSLEKEIPQKQAAKQVADVAAQAAKQAADSAQAAKQAADAAQADAATKAKAVTDATKASQQAQTQAETAKEKAKAAAAGEEAAAAAYAEADAAAQANPGDAEAQNRKTAQERALAEARRKAAVEKTKADTAQADAQAQAVILTKTQMQAETAAKTAEAAKAEAAKAEEAAKAKAEEAKAEEAKAEAQTTVADTTIDIEIGVVFKKTVAILDIIMNKVAGALGAIFKFIF